MTGEKRSDDQANDTHCFGPASDEFQPGIPADASPSLALSTDFPQPFAHVVLHQPQIPQNTGNIGRSCVATGSKLWIVQPAAFQIDEKRVRRAGLDYWQHLNWEDTASWEDLRSRLPETPQRRFWYFSRFAEQPIWEADFQPGEVFVFGSETLGLPRTIFKPGDANALRLPTTAAVRSLNLSSTVAIVLYETVRRAMTC